MRTQEELEEIRVRNGLPEAPEDLIDMRYIMSSGDWQIKTTRGWYILISGEWKFMPNGPPDMNWLEWK